jgi:peptide subunit release factor 1 (eRF1)
MTSVDTTYRMIMQEHAERQAQGHHRQLAREAAHERALRRAGVRSAVGSALIRVGTRLAARPAQPSRGLVRAAGH